MHKDPTEPRSATRRDVVVVLILTLALLFLCTALGVGVVRLVAAEPHLGLLIWQE